MKKSRIMLTIMCLFAIIGGALALKVHHDKFTGTLYCAYTPTTSCTGLTTGVSLRLTTTGDIMGYCTTVFGGICTTERYVINE